MQVFYFVEEAERLLTCQNEGDLIRVLYISSWQLDVWSVSLCGLSRGILEVESPAHMDDIALYSWRLSFLMHISYCSFHLLLIFLFLQNCDRNNWITNKNIISRYLHAHCTVVKPIAKWNFKAGFYLLLSDSMVWLKLSACDCSNRHGWEQEHNRPRILRTKTQAKDLYHQVIMDVLAGYKCPLEKNGSILIRTLKAGILLEVIG